MNRVVCAAALAYSFTLPAIALPVSIFDLDRIVEGADSVCVCRVNHVTRQLPRPDRAGRFQAECAVLAVFKGAHSEHVRVKALIDPSCCPGSAVLGDLSEGDVGILFLRLDPEQEYTFADNQHPWIPLSQFYGAQEQEGDVRERICRQLTAALESQTSAEALNALHWLALLEETVSREALDALAQSCDLHLRAAALKHLVAQDDISAIREAGDLLLSPDIDKLPKRDLHELAWALELKPDIVGIRTATALASSANTLVQRVGVRILRKVGDKTSIPYLMRALDAADRDTQMSAVVGLSRITGRKGASWREFMTGSQVEKERWKDWWRQEGEAEHGRTDGDFE